MILFFSQPRLSPIETDSFDDTRQWIRQVNYGGWENETFYFEPLGCMASVVQINGESIPLRKRLRVCYHPVTRQLSENFHIGTNVIVASSSDVRKRPVYIGPRLIGGFWLSSLGGVTCILFILVMLSMVIRRWGFSSIENGLLVLTVLYFFIWLIKVTNLSRANDVVGHVNYILHMKSLWMSPWLYRGYESFQPPLYYLISAFLHTVTEKLLIFNPLYSVRLFSMVLMTIFLGFSIKTLKEGLSCRGSSYYVGLAQIAFWPALILMATRINNDIPLYTIWGVGFYFLLRWMQTPSPSSLALAIGACGIGWLIKANIVPFILVVGICIGMRWRQFKWPLSYFLQRPLLTSYAIFLTGFFFYAGWSHFTRINYELVDPGALWRGQSPIQPPLHHFFFFNVGEFFEHPFIRWPATRPEVPFLNYFLRTALFGEFSFRHAWLGTILSGLFVVHLGWTLGMTLKLIRQSWSDIAPLVISLIFPMLVLMIHAGLKDTAMCQDSRFVFPILVPYVILFTKGLDLLLSERKIGLYRLGCGVGAAFPLVGVIFYLSQF